MNMIIKTIRHLLYYFSLYSWASWVIMKNTLRLPFLPPAGINKIFSGYCSKFMSWVNFIISIDYKVKGQENVPLDRPLIIAVKHQSGYEAVALNTILPPTIVMTGRISLISSGFTVKMSLSKSTISARYPGFMRPLMSSINSP